MEITLLFIALCVSAISFTITTTTMFTWFRELLAKVHPKIEELVFCPWCFSHWITFIILLTSNVQLVQVTEVKFYNFMVTTFAIVAVSGLCHYILLRAYKPVAKSMMSRKMLKLKSKN